MALAWKASWVQALESSNLSPSASNYKQGYLVKIHLLESDGWEKMPALSREEVGGLVRLYAEEAAGILGDLSPKLNIIVKPDLPHVNERKGVGGSTYDHELLDLTFMSNLPLGVDDFKRYLRETTLHELNHALYMRFHPREGRQLWWVTLEGLGTVFDREYAGGSHEFTDERYQVNDEMIEWLGSQEEASTRSPNPPENWGDMMYSTGVWLVDRAIMRSGKSVVQLTRLSCDEILELAEVKTC